MSSAAAALRKAAAAASAASSAAHMAASVSAIVSAPVPAHVAASSAAPKAAKPASQKAAPLECAEFNKTGKPCSRGQKCRDERCRKASKSAAPSPKPAVKGGDGGVSAQLAAMQKKLDQIEVKIDSGFEAQEKRSLALQEKGSKAYAETMEMFKIFGNMMTGGFTANNTAHRELPALLARPAICTGSRSSVTEVVETSFSRGGGSSASEVRDPGMTGTHMDNMMTLCSRYGFPPEGYVYNVFCALFGTNPVSDHHKSLLSTISEHTKNDALAALLFLLLTGSTQFTKASFNAFRTECDTFLGSNKQITFTTFSLVCESFIKKCPKWEIKKKDSVKASNSQLKDKAQHPTAFDALVKNFQS
jgi:hypothetical protein